MKNILVILACFFLITACNKDEKNEQELIENFIAESEYDFGNPTASGLYYAIIREGDGGFPDASDFVTVDYEGTLLDGTVFDSSYDRGAPFSFSMAGGVIDGWIEGVKFLNRGSKGVFVIPSDLAYGQTGNANIEPNTPLFFEIELIDF